MATKKAYVNKLLITGIVLISVFIKWMFFPSFREPLISFGNQYNIHSELSDIRIAIYRGRGMDRHSALALCRAFQWMGCRVEPIRAANIRDGDLHRIDVLALPGGANRPDPWKKIGSEGKERIQEFIRNGGGYIGICLGALYACENCLYWGDTLGVKELYLELFPGMAYCGQEKIAPEGVWPLMTGINVSDQMHSITGSLDSRVEIVYYPGSPYFKPDSGADITIIAQYRITQNPAMVAFKYGKGNVFLSGPHPEIEVDSRRDGSNRFNELADEGSEWSLLLAVIQWMTSD